MKLKPQVYGFVTIIIALAALLLWTTQSVWHRLSQLRRDFGAAHSDSFHLAEQVQVSFLAMNEAVPDRQTRRCRFKGGKPSTSPISQNDFMQREERRSGWLASV